MARLDSSLLALQHPPGPHPYLLRLARPADPADGFVEDGLLGLFARRGPPAASRAAPGSLPSPLQRASSADSYQRALECTKASMTLGRSLVRLLIAFIKGFALGTGMYATDYLLVNGHAARLLEAAAAALGLAGGAPVPSGGLRILPASA